MTPVKDQVRCASKANQIKRILVGLAIDQHEIRQKPSGPFQTPLGVVGWNPCTWMHEHRVNLPQHAMIECLRLSRVERAWRSLSVDLHGLFLIVY